MRVPSSAGTGRTNVDRPILWGWIGTIALVWAFSLYIAFGVEEDLTVEDVFAPATALFSGLALVGIVRTLALQKQEIDEHRHTNEKRLIHEIDQKKLDVTFAMHRELNSESMHKSRNIAGSIVKTYPLLSISEYHNQLPVEETVHLSHVMGFYYRLAVLLKHDQVDKRYLPELFGQNLLWWYVQLFKGRSAPDWENVRGIKYLVQVIKAEVPSDYKRWRKRARLVRKAYLKGGHRERKRKAR
jgi:hypothetical protein